MLLADRPTKKSSMAAPASTATPPAQLGLDHRSQAAPPLTIPDHPVGTLAEATPDLSNLEQSISSVRLYAPGRLHHLQRTPGTTPDVVEAEDGVEESGADEAGDKPEEKKRSMLSKIWRKGKKIKKVPEQFVLVRGEPSEARFEFIAVRQTWISDHMLDPMLEALLSAEMGQPVSDK